MEAVESDTELRHDIIGAFRGTLILDPRYNVIANVLAHYAYENELDALMSDTQLVEECQAWWPEGFAKLYAEAFRSYLSELVGLGVLRPDTDGVGWRLRSPNALSMIGTSEEVETELVRAKTESVPPEVIARQTRRTLIDGARWPITISQVNDLLGDHINQVRLVLGSGATGIENVTATMSEVVREHGERFQYVVAGGRRDFTEALTIGTPGRRRLILSDLAANGTKPEGCWESLSSAIHMRPVTSGVTRSVILVADTTTQPKGRQVVHALRLPPQSPGRRWRCRLRGGPGFSPDLAPRPCDTRVLVGLRSVRRTPPNFLRVTCSSLGNVLTDGQAERSDAEHGRGQLCALQPGPDLGERRLP
ncbi:hypothetical protein ACFYUV_09625 [Nonomuraea sp. NPDC003560]|uniref:hypothetical protein n=1 Tax=Nonomuraea sp. NPDC003560 TaxID=3364341 RepID=UPI0036C1E643